MWLLVLLFRAAAAQFPTTLRLEKAVVETGDSEMCQVFALDASKRFSKARPVLGSSAAWVEYMEVYSCSPGISASQGATPGTCTQPKFSSITSSCRELLFLWSRGMGSDHVETLPNDIAGLKSEDGWVMLRVTYRSVDSRSEDTTGMELTEEAGPVPNGKEGGRMVIGHRIPRLLVLPGLKEWRSAAVCSTDCLNLMGEEAWGIDLVKLTILTGNKSTSARLSRVDQSGDITQLAVVSLSSGWGEADLSKAQLLPTDSLVLECVYDSSALKVPMLGGVGQNQEHCMALLSYEGVSSVLECRSQPTDFSMTYALNLTLQGGGNEYVDYTNEIEEAFESVLESTDEDYSSFGKRRRRRQTSNGERVVDSFLDDVFTDQGLTVRDALLQMQTDSIRAAKINEAMLQNSEHAVFCDTREEMLDPLKTASLNASAPGVLATWAAENNKGSQQLAAGPIVALFLALARFLRRENAAL